MKQHPPLKAVCEELFERSELDATVRVALALCLEKVDPEGWRVHIDPKTSTASVMRGR
jgi:hypothetical protein